MKSILLILLFFASLPLYAPVNHTVFIASREPVNYYEPLIRAVVYVESENGQHLYNEVENAVGYFQIRPIRVLDYNQRTGSNYKHEDFYDYELSRKMFLYYTKGRSFESVARRWNGSGKKTIQYWNEVKKRM